MSDRYYGYRTKVYGTELDGHDIELEFDKSRIVLNEARLVVDGQTVDQAKIFYGEEELTVELPGGDTVVVTVHSGMIGELTRAQIKRPDGSWTDLEERQPR